MERERVRRSAGLFAGVTGEVDGSLAMFDDTAAAWIARDERAEDREGSQPCLSS